MAVGCGPVTRCAGADDRVLLSCRDVSRMVESGGIHGEKTGGLGAVRCGAVRCGAVRCGAVRFLFGAGS